MGFFYTPLSVSYQKRKPLIVTLLDVVTARVSSSDETHSDKKLLVQFCAYCTVFSLSHSIVLSPETQATDCRTNV